MKVVYYQSIKGNFGDELNKWLWPKLLNDYIEGFCRHGVEFYKDNDKESLLFYGIGTLLDERIPPRPQKVIFGSGYGYNTLPKIDENFKIFCLRGPKTAAALGVCPEFAITDAAILLRNFYPAATDTPKKYPISFMPHIDSENGGFWRTVCMKCGVNYISPGSFNVEVIINQLMQSEVLITEAMHGAIVADALRVPWYPIASLPSINPFKWNDWCASMKLSYNPFQVIPIYQNDSNSLLKNWITKVKFFIRLKQFNFLLKSNPSYYLSEDEVFFDRLLRMNNKLEELKLFLDDYKVKGKFK